jgi:secretion/DNA translocation related TadE-like protein
MPLRPRGRSSRERSAVTRERGSATVVSVAVVCVVLVLGLALAALGGHLRDRATARAGADLAALAGASAVRARLDGAGVEPCEAAARVAGANAGTLTNCAEYDDGSVQVAVKSGRATASARAGPAAQRGSG